MAVQFGNTWWGKQWLNAFTHIDFSNRLPRGRTYARNGSVKSMLFEKPTITGKVQGSQRTPYKVKITVTPFTSAEKKTILETITGNPAFLAKLLSRELPSELKDALAKQRIHVFPGSWRDMEATCSCPDYAVPCKHIAAIIYLFANEIDKNPFLVFELHGMDLLSQIEEAGYKGAQQAVASVPPVQDLLQHLQKERPATVPDALLLQKLDFLVIPECRNELLSLLSANPLFFEEGDFKKILEKKLKAVSQQATKALLAMEDPAEDKQSPEVYPEKVTAIHIILNYLFIPQQVHLQTLQETFWWRKGKHNPVQQLAAWLGNIAPVQLYQYGMAVQALAAVRRLSLVLLKQGAVLPQILNLTPETYSMVWRPALLKEEVKQQAEMLSGILPPDILQVQAPSKKDKPKEKYFDPLWQVTELLSLFITALLPPLFMNITAPTEANTR